MSDPYELYKAYACGPTIGQMAQHEAELAYRKRLAAIGAASITHKDAFVQSLARDLVLQGKGPDTAARLARATWAELYPAPQVSPIAGRATVDPDDLYHAVKQQDLPGVK